MTRTPLETVEAFHHFLNARQPDELLALAADDVRVGGSRGSGTGKDLLREWVEASRATMTPQRILARDETVVVEQLAEWREARTGEISSRQTVATVFRVRDGVITAIARYSHFAEAANKAGLDEDDAVIAG